ncbi:molybdenum-dependent oxidoreductase-like protein [Neobacillus bataviensis]|uniref:Molybdenum-dependent oxidoreductase-like protein n=1 Tax=Neobacillus bataviensis TaxID=220685 RepID=A0A561D682_9BACI|nr:sulfite oxidase [Neobacillus bataviensis]TWD98727.1 molybdenum-dependent oxidoreductase-like protein [Neobacillus bataviensis]
MKKFHQPGVKPYLITKSLNPENQETPIQFINNNIVDGNLFYRRNHFSYPHFTSSFYFLPIHGFVHTPRTFSLQEIYSLPSRTIKVVLECSGDKRDFFEPKAFGEQWEKGAISQGIWKGVSLRTLLQYTGVIDAAKELVFEGYDYGERPDSDQMVNFSRSLPIEKALEPDTIIAYEYNNQPIPFKHGFPLRLIVPGWYAMASVKWIKSITVIDKEFKGPYQTVDYVYYPNKEDDSGKFPVTTINVNSTIQYPLNRQLLTTGLYHIKGIAWTGKGSIDKVEISLDDGHTWETCQLTSTSEKYSWVSWNYQWEVLKKGEYTIKSKATDSHANVQPSKPFWNRKGYGYNAVDHIKVKVE